MYKYYVCVYFILHGSYYVNIFTLQTIIGFNWIENVNIDYDLIFTAVILYSADVSMSLL